MTRICPSKTVYRKTLGILQLWGHRESNNSCCSRGTLLPHAIPSRLLSFAWLLPELKMLKFLPEGDTMTCLGLAWQRKARRPPLIPTEAHYPPLSCTPTSHGMTGFYAWNPWKSNKPTHGGGTLWSLDLSGSHEHSWRAKKKQDHG